jgi:serine/threonine protein kinase/tetratricopeptide (TPR) repeat protein
VDELNRDLLVAVLALLTDAIPRDALFAALGDWARDRQQTLSQILVRNRAIDPDRLRALLCLSESHLARHRDDLRACLDVWHAQGVTEEILTGIGDVGLKTTLGVAVGLEATLPADPGEGGGDETMPAGGVGETIAVADGSLPGSVLPPPSAGADRFRPIRLHAKGGIGQVWVARDGELQREVALKVIQDRFAERPDQRARFLLEAEITGNLEHPGIVPDYSVGRNDQGHPYYAMRFIRGESLSSAIRRFHLRWRGKEAEADRSGARWGVEFRELLGRFLDVCDAIGYAHSRGVLHRDLKPANIMLGRYGETLVVDWGLAKVIGEPDIVPAVAGGDAEPSLTASVARSTSGDTQPGTTIGTPSYMSPEQARGALDEMGPASDVYSLGATLYELLTGQVAFQGEKTEDVIRRVVKGDFPPPRALLRSVPAPLEAICLKAMALERRQRYNTMRELARDIRHWLADEPVLAYPEGWLERRGRWLRRHRTWTYAIAAALLGITVAATVGMVLVENGRRREREARALAETNYNLVKKAVDDYFTKVSEDTLLSEQDSVDLRRLRGELLKTALGYYREFLRQRSGDPKLRRELADAQFRVGQIRREIGPSEDAIAAFHAAIALWDELRAEAPDDRQVRMQLARTYMALGEQFTATQDFPRAFDALSRSRGLLAGLEAEAPGDVSHRFDLAVCIKDLGIAEANGGTPERALEWLREAEAILGGLLAASPRDTAYRKQLAGTINAEGIVHFRQGHDDEALRAFRELQRICLSLLADLPPGPKPSQILNDLAVSYYNVGTILYRRDRAKALETFEESLKYRTALADSNPSVHAYRENLAVSLTVVAHLHHELGRDADAFSALEKSVQLLKALISSQPDQPSYHAELGRALHILGFLYDEGRDNRRAMEALEQARIEEERAVTYAPEIEQYRLYLADILWNLGEQSVDLGQVDAGLPHYRTAVEIRRKVLLAHPRDRDQLLGLAEQLERLAAVERAGGDPEAAERSYAEAIAVLGPLASEAAADVQVRRGTLLMGEGLAAADLGRNAEALPLLRQAVSVLSPFVTIAQGDPRPRWRLTEALWATAWLLRRAGDTDGAARVEADREALWRGRPPGELAGLALDETTQAAQVGYGRVPVNERAEAVRCLGLDLAAANLRLALGLGFRDFSALRKNPDAPLLLLREDVRPFIDQLGFPEDPFRPDAGAR